MGEGRSREQRHLVGSLDQVGGRPLRQRTPRPKNSRERSLQSRRTRPRLVRPRTPLKLFEQGRSPCSFLIAGCRVTPAEGSVKPTAGFTFNKVTCPSPRREHLGEMPYLDLRPGAA